MKTKLIIILALLFGVIGITQARWINAAYGELPGYALKVGREANGQVLYLCRARFEGSVTPGKIRSDFNGCHISYGGQEIIKRRYRVFLPNYNFHGHWKHMGRYAPIPRRAWSVGEDSNGNTLFLCRSHFQGSVTPGKTWEGLKGCDIAYGGREFTVRHYQVFVRRWRR